MSDIILYDIPSKDRCASWSLNPWKTRLALNYKSLPYTTQWLEYPSIAPTLQSLNLAPNPSDPPYTIPAIRFPDGSSVMDSRKIASELETRFPEPSLHLDAPELPLVESILAKGLTPLRAVLLPRVPDALLNPISAEYYFRTRKERFGISIEQLEKEKGGEPAWKEAEPALRELGDLLRKKGGPFVLGATVSYADFVVVGVLQFAKRIDEALYERAVDIEPALGQLYKASAGWLERDGY